MRKSLIFLLAVQVMLVLYVGYMTAQDKAAPDARREPDKAGADAKREADRREIEKLAKEFVQAFEKRDAEAVVASWTADGEFIRNDGMAIRGRTEVQKAYADFFKKLTGKPKLEASIEDLRFPSADTAIADVTLRLKNEEGETLASSWRNSLLVREDGKWKVALVREWDRDVAQDDTLKELEWLIGTWQTATKTREVTTTYEWDDNKAFIRGKFTVKEDGKVIETGTQMIGKDNADGVIRSWVFVSDGGFGGGIWTREGKKWTVEVRGVMPEGKELTATNIFIHLDPNTYSWQAVNQKLDGVSLPDTLPIKVTKKQAPK